MVKQYYLVGVPVVEGVGRTEVVEYIRDAVSTWGGQFSPEDPLGPPCPYGETTSVQIVSEERYRLLTRNRFEPELMETTR